MRWRRALKQLSSEVRGVLASACCRNEWQLAEIDGQRWRLASKPR